MSPAQRPVGGARRQRFVHVFATFGRGGPQVRAAQLLRHLGGDCEHVVMAMDGNTDARAMLGEGVDVTFVAPPQRGGLLATRRRQMAWLRDMQPDLVLTYNWGAIETVAAARALRLPLVHHEDGFGPGEAQRRHARRNWLRRFLLRSVPVIVPSHVLADIARREWWIRGERLHLLANGVDLLRFRPAQVDEAPRGALLLGTVGGLRPEKDHDNLLRAFAALPATVAGDPLRLLVVGSGPLEAATRATAAQLGVAERVTFAGHTDDTAASYRGMHVFVLSSRTEQMPIAMLEAMASGLPVVATDVGDVRVILPASAKDLIVPREDPVALAAALRRVVDDAALRQRLGADNRATVERDYEAATCLERFAAVYRAAAARR